MPRLLPTPAAAITMPSSRVLSRLLIGCSRSRKARNKVKNPVSSRAPITQRSPCSTLGFRFRNRRWTRSLVGSTLGPVGAASSPPMSRSPADESTLGDSRMASTVAPTKTAKPNRSDHSGPAWEMHDREPAADRGPADLGHGDPGVGVDQGEPVGQQPGHGRRLGHGEGLRGDQAAERGREEHQGVVQRVGQHPAQETAQREGDPDRPPPAVPEAVEERSDEGRHDRERGHGQQQELRDLGSGLFGGQGEEQGAGQGDGDDGIAGGGQELQVHQPGQTAVAGPAGGGEVVHRARSALDLMTDEPAARGDGAPRTAAGTRLPRIHFTPSRRQGGPSRHGRRFAAETARMGSMPSTTRTIKPDATCLAAVDLARAAAEETAGADGRRRPSRSPRRRRPGGHPLLRLPAPRLPGLALVGDGGPGLAGQGGHRRRGGPAARRRVDARAGLGAVGRTHPAR